MAQVGHEDSLCSEIQRHREQLATCPKDHPQRGNACHELATSLYRSWTKTPSTALLTEVITLNREALDLRPGGHSDHAHSCYDLANALLDRYRVAGGPDLLDETIKLHREALSLRPSGHPDRAHSCNSLANALRARYQMTGSSALLDEIIKLHREALALRPAEHPDHAVSCSNLANILLDRYYVTGTTSLLDETIMLYGKALVLRPAGHPYRATACTNIANALLRRYRATGDSAVLDDTIAFCREALALQPTRHPTRAISCTNLANALLHRYQETGGSALLDETIKLHREALALRPGGHPSRALSCYELADSLWQYCGKTRDEMVVNHAVALAHQSATSWSPSDAWQPLLLLCSIHLDQWSSYFSISTATEYLLQASSSTPANIVEFMREIQSHLDRMWLMQGTWTPDTTHLLLDVYSNIIDRLSEMTGFAFDIASQLTALRSARSYGSDACVAALLSGRSCQAIELIDHAHGVIWAQALHQRDPQLQDLPKHIASELETLLRAVSVSIGIDAGELSMPEARYLSPEDLRHEQNSRIQTILTEVRAMPGLERFMLGKTYAQLRETAKEHPVVVLVSARGHVYALVIQNAAQDHPHVLHLDITTDRLSLLRDTAARAGLRQGGQGEATVQDLEVASERAMRMSRHKEASPLATLADLWHGVVKPVVAHLQLRVRLRGVRLPLLS
jgi:hypothetical protein